MVMELDKKKRARELRNTPGNKTPKQNMGRDYLEWLKEDEAEKLNMAREKSSRRNMSKEELAREEKERLKRVTTKTPKNKEELQREAKEEEKLRIEWENIWENPF